MSMIMRIKFSVSYKREKCWLEKKKGLPSITGQLLKYLLNN